MEDCCQFFEKSLFPASQPASCNSVQATTSQAGRESLQLLCPAENQAAFAAWGLLVWVPDMSTLGTQQLQLLRDMQVSAPPAASRAQHEPQKLA